MSEREQPLLRTFSRDKGVSRENIPLQIDMAADRQGSKILGAAMRDEIKQLAEDEKYPRRRNRDNSSMGQFARTSDLASVAQKHQLLKSSVHEFHSVSKSQARADSWAPLELVNIAVPNNVAERSAFLPEAMPNSLQCVPYSARYAASNRRMFPQSARDCRSPEWRHLQ